MSVKILVDMSLSLSGREKGLTDGWALENISSPGEGTAFALREGCP